MSILVLRLQSLSKMQFVLDNSMLTDKQENFLIRKLASKPNEVYVWIGFGRYVLLT